MTSYRFSIKGLDMKFFKRLKYVRIITNDRKYDKFYGYLSKLN